MDIDVRVPECKKGCETDDIPCARPAPARIASARNFPPEPPTVPKMSGAAMLPGKTNLAASHLAAIVPTLKILEHTCK